MNHAVPHDQNLLFIVGTADGDNFPADARGGDGVSLRPAVSGGDDNDETGIPGGIDTADENGIFPHISAGEGADGDVDDSDIKLLLMLADPAQPGEHIGSASASLTIEDFYRNQAASGGNSAKAPAGERTVSGDDAADVGSVAIVIVGQRSAPNDVAEGSDLSIEIRMGSASGIEHGNTNA